MSWKKLSSVDFQTFCQNLKREKSIQSNGGWYIKKWNGQKDVERE